MSRTASRRAEGRSWLSHGLAAVGISVLGLGVAGSVSLPGNAQPAELPGSRSTTPLGPVGGASWRPGRPAEPVAEASGTVAAAEPALRAFVRTEGASTTVDPALHRAKVAERAAQRSETLAKAAEAATRAGRDAGRDARARALAEAGLARQQEAARLAQEERQRAAAERAAAERAAAERATAERAAAERAAAERASAARAGAASGTPAPTPTPPPTDPTTAPNSAPRAASVPSGGSGASPVPGAVVGASFGQRGLWARYHTGLDFRASAGTPIRSVKPGVVVFAGNRGDWAGNHVAVRHADGMTTMYSHMSALGAGNGDTVAAGEVIGYVGSTGRSFGAHLHFELYPAGVAPGDVYRAVNPLPWLGGAGVRTR